MKRLFAVFTLCATTLIAASAVSGPAAADGRHDGRRQAGQSDHQTNRIFADRGTQRRAFRDHRDRRHHKFRRHHKRHRHAHGYRHRHGYSLRRNRLGYRMDYRMGPAHALQLNGARFIFRFD